MPATGRAPVEIESDTDGIPRMQIVEALRRQDDIEEV
jgi:hypothetical protein